jgi:hypothetical protein
VDDRQADAALATPPATMAEAAENVESVLGDAITWSRDFHVATREDGTTQYVDKRTGEMYDTLPAMHDKDGHDT